VLGSTAAHSQLVNIPLFATYLLSQRDEPTMNFLNATSGDTPMRKAIIATFAAASLLAISAPAFAGYWYHGWYYPSCYWYDGFLYCD
jgi:hypothetical protein